MEKQSQQRLLSLDIFRGLTVAGMILVNLQGNGQSFNFLHHVDWYGFSFADAVFPFFLFIVGASIFFAQAKFGFTAVKPLIKKILLRGMWIFLIGILLNIFPFNTPPESWRIFGVLQRIAIVYVLVSLAVIWLKTPRKLLMLSTLILLLYWLTTALTGDTLQHNLAAIVDTFLVGSSHMYSVDGVSYDPEGLLGSLPSMVNALLGYLTAYWIVRKGNSGRTALLLFASGIVLVIASIAWDTILPFSKKMWTSSFSLLTSGLGMATLSILYYIVDIRKLKAWGIPFKVFGTNALFAYILSELIGILNGMLTFQYHDKVYHLSGWLYHFVFCKIPMTQLQSLAWGVLVLLFCWGVTGVLYYRRVFIRI